MQTHAGQEALAARLMDRIRSLCAEKRPAEALPLVETLRRLPGEKRGLDGLRARVLAALGQLAEANAAADAALGETPGDAELLLLRARLHFAAGRQREGLDDAAAAVMAAPASAEAKGVLGSALLDIGRHEEALFLLGAALRAEPDSLAARIRLGQGFVATGKHEAADEILALAEAQAPANPLAAGLRAQNALLADQPQRAVELAQAALARSAVDASVHSVLGHALIALHRNRDAGPYLAAAARLAPGNSYLQHLAAACNGETTERPGADYVTQVFDGYAARFEASLLSLGYRVPGLVRRAVEQLVPGAAEGARLGPVLDLGCGTGLVGAALWDLVGPALVGVDLSPRMLEHARQKGIYSELRQGDLLELMAEDQAGYALVVAADVFIYLGGLGPVLRLCRERLAPGGLLVFSVERIAEGEGYRLGPSGRYAHAPDSLRADLAAAGLEPVLWRAEDLRLEGTEPVPGLLVAARAAAH